MKKVGNTKAVKIVVKIVKRFAVFYTILSVIDYTIPISNTLTFPMDLKITSRSITNKNWVCKKIIGSI